MRLKFRQGWNGHRVGQVIDLPDGMANTLIKRGFAEVVMNGTATLSPKAETASFAQFGKRQKRG